ncbi:MAG: YdeI/OmpD-associated family protein [Planctomycetota bacterium]
MSDPSPQDEHLFEAEVTTHDVGGYNYTVVYVPQKILKHLPMKKYPRLRVNAQICGVATEAALQPCRGEWYLMVPKRIQKAASIGVGDSAMVRFTIADQDFVDVPTELLHAIEARSKACKVWDSLTPGKKRGYAYRVSSAKRDETKYRRVEDIIEELEGLYDK